MIWYYLLPIMMMTAQPYAWPERGYGIGWQYPDVSTAALTGWHYDWNPVCPEDLHIPMVWDDDAERLPPLAQCNDGRPVLLLNEPERSNQANMSPERAAALVHSLASWWEGEVWCCGQNALAVAWTDEFVRLHRERYGSLPLAGWHVHSYANNTLASERDFASLVEPWRAEAALKQVDAFQGRFGGRIIISEMGALTADYWHTPEQLVPLMRAFEAGIDRRPHVESAAWFAAYEPQQFTSSNLLTATGQLTVLGQEWGR